MVTEPYVDMHSLPRHVAIIMDGNGRWAKNQNRPRLYGHKIGAESVRVIVETCRELGIDVLTLYAFSSENWKRPKSEVSGLMAILKSYLTSEISEMQRNGVRLHSIGDVTMLPESARAALEDAKKQTAGNSEFVLNLALSYGARNELTRAFQAIAAKCLAGECQPEQISAQYIASHLDTAGLPDPDLVIRTGGESRLSNFLLWQASYAEIYFTEVMWPDFRKPQFMQAISDYQSRERRFGKTSAQISDG